MIDVQAHGSESGGMWQGFRSAYALGETPTSDDYRMNERMIIPHIMHASDVR